MEVEFHRLAAQEYLAARRWYARRSASGARSFQNAVDLTVERIAANPQQGTPFRSDYRWMRAGRFPYLLYYTILDDSRVIIMAVAHARRRLGYWRRRQPES